jgi:syntaxin-binding protein 1
LNDIFKKRFLTQIATEEQDMATGKDVNGNTPKYDIADLLRKKEIPNSDKLRLIMLYVISKGGIKKDAQKKLVDVAKLTVSEENALNNLSIVKPPKSFTFGGVFSNLFGTKKSSTNEDIGYELSRYLPVVKDLSLKILKGNLSEKEFPYLAKPSSDFKIESNKPTKKIEKIEEEEIGGGRLGGPSWNFLPGKKEEDNLLTKEVKKNEYKLYIFVVGGVTLSEARSAYELEKEFNMEVIIGGTSILRPVDFLQKLGEINLPSDGNKIGGHDDDELSV